ncbi:hypothetical protein GF345_05020 [Candidatus Woesearchaeota archaeon]|nr:hypothetical protein [Candidatus Woesearchaeota archaeon]
MHESGHYDIPSSFDLGLMKSPLGFALSSHDTQKDLYHRCVTKADEEGIQGHERMVLQLSAAVINNTAVYDDAQSRMTQRKSTLGKAGQEFFYSVLERVAHGDLRGLPEAVAGILEEQVFSERGHYVPQDSQYLM